jgi:hypothetical protein
VIQIYSMGRELTSDGIVNLLHGCPTSVYG